MVYTRHDTKFTIELWEGAKVGEARLGSRARSPSRTVKSTGGGRRYVQVTDTIKEK